MTDAIQSTCLTCFESHVQHPISCASWYGCLKWRVVQWELFSYIPHSPLQRNWWVKAPPPQFAHGRNASWLLCSRVCRWGYTALPAIIKSMIGQRRVEILQYQRTEMSNVTKAVSKTTCQRKGDLYVHRNSWGYRVQCGFISLWDGLVHAAVLIYFKQ